MGIGSLMNPQGLLLIPSYISGLGRTNYQQDHPTIAEAALQ
jgi:hypothetical protein